MEKLKDVLGVIGTVLVISLVIVFLANMDIKFAPLNSKEFYMFIGSIVFVIVANISFKRVEFMFDRESKRKNNKQ